MTRRVERDSSEPDPYATDDAALAAIWEGFERFLVNAYLVEILITLAREPIYENQPGAWHAFLRQRGYVADGDPVMAKALGR